MALTCIQSRLKETKETESMQLSFSLNVGAKKGRGDSIVINIVMCPISATGGKGCYGSFDIV